MPRLHYVTFACSEPSDLAAFWAAALDGERRDLPPTIDPVIVDLPHDGPDLLFKDLPCASREDLAVHLDVEVEDREAGVARLRDLGATVRETKTETFDGHTETWTVMEDPAGNGFCVSESPE